MKALNKQTLRNLAEKALQGKWNYEANAIWNTDESGWVQHMAAVEAGDDISDEEHKSNMQFITAFTPAVVLDLLDELSESQAREANESKCADSVIDLAINWQMRCKDTEAKLEAAEKRIAEQQSAIIAPGIMRCAGCGFVLTKNSINMAAGTITAGDSKTEPCPNGCGPLWPVTWKEHALQMRDDSEKWFEELQEANRRIAELEAREVKLPKPISVLHRRDFNDAHRAIYAYPEAEVNAALATAGIGVKGE
ncbi:ead/Ea22-like family protein [Salmonella enterica]|nr:ead/Ea22-like family protein [Salmonella enterica]EAU0858545.1 ead/Ea22-like family protein [Salmonella enterica]